jgi:hypothetical protein
LPEAEDLDEFEAAPGIATNAPRFRADAEGTIEAFTATLRTRERAELLLGFPAAPFILALGADDPDRFIEYAEHHPTHTVRLRRTGSGMHAEWAMSPWEGPDAYRLSFSLPERIESWISENEERRVRRTSDIKTDFLSEITIYRRLGDNMRIYQLRYEPSQLYRSTS